MEGVRTLQAMVEATPANQLVTLPGLYWGLVSLLRVDDELLFAVVLEAVVALADRLFVRDRCVFDRVVGFFFFYWNWMGVVSNVCCVHSPF